jgi:flagellar basal body-associated protein FliL
MVEFGGIVVNLAGSGNSRFLRTTFTIASSEKDIAKFIEEKKDSLKDAAISVLSTQSLDVLDGANGREVVRKGIITRFNNVLGADMIDQIYFTEFLIQ